MFKFKYPESGHFFYATVGSAGFDIAADEDVVIYANDWQVISTGLYIVSREPLQKLQFSAKSYSVIPELQIRSRSGLSIKYGVCVLGAPCTIDYDYTGHIKVPLINHGKTTYRVKNGDRIAQGVCLPTFRLDCFEVKTIERGSQGFGSSDESKK